MLQRREERQLERLALLVPRVRRVFVDRLGKMPLGQGLGPQTGSSTGDPAA